MSDTGRDGKPPAQDGENRGMAVRKVAVLDGDGPAVQRKMPPLRRDAPAPADSETDATADPARRAGKYAVLEVPAFDGEQMTSYLRLGAEPRDRAEPGEDLERMLSTFLDDERIRDPQATPIPDRLAETARLHTKGGWRDHSDGNRITTTRGDKIEVIRGNYKILVLGRQDDPAGGTGWDLSGGHIEGVNGGVGGMTQIDWVQTFDGTWRVRETSEKGDTISTQHGNSVSTSYGDIMDSTTGSESGVFTAEDGSTLDTNPVITDRTWAKSISSFTGSAASPVPLVSDETWVQAMASKTNVDEMTDDTTVNTSMSSATTVNGTMTDTTMVNGSMTSSTTVSGSMVDNTTVGSMQSMTHAETMTDITIAGSVTSVNLAGSTTDLTVGATTSLTVGAVADLTIGAMFELTLALMTEITVGGTLEIKLAGEKDIDLGEKLGLKASKKEVTGSTTTVTGDYKVTAGAVLMTAGAYNFN